MISVTFPVPQEKIVETTTKLREELARLDAERQVTIAMLRQVQQFCRHEGQKGYTDYGGGWDLTPCTKCGFTT